MANTYMKQSSQIANPELISRFKKERFLLGMSEDGFRDQIIRPLFLRQGLTDGRDLCGVTEQGKDAVFLHEDKLGMTDCYVVQTKKGNLNLSSKANQNLIQAITQLKTALETKIPMHNSKKKVIPSKAFLCASGKINDSARHHIVEEVGDPRIAFFDSNDLIPMLDEHMPELWLGIDSDLFPYLRVVKELVEIPSEEQSVGDLFPSGSVPDAATDTMFVQLRLHRTVLKLVNRSGVMELVPKFENLPVTGILSRKERLVLLLGDAGAGKSTSIKRLAYLLALRGLASDSDYNIPILLRATEVWNSADQPLLEVCVSATMRLMKSSKPSFSNNDLIAGRIVVLLDGLDELASDEARLCVVRKARDFHKEFPMCRIIVTSRDYPFIKTTEGLNDYAQFHLFPIDYKQAEQILKRFEKKRSLSSEKSKEILRRLQDVHGMELNPLLVTVFAATTDFSRRDIPANITELFKKYTEMMLGRWDAGKGLAQQYHAPLKDFLLRKTAFEMHRRRVTSISVSEFTSLVEAELTSRGHKAEVAQLTDEILNRSGLFRVFAERAEFRHHLLQEFFAGRGVPNNEFLDTIVSDEWWQRAIVFYFGENPGDSDVFFKLMPALVSRPISEIYTASLTLGLALQACYLMSTEEKARVIPWVIDGLSAAKELFLKVADEEGVRPLSKFLTYYIIGRDSVACAFLRDRLQEVSSLLLRADQSQEDHDIRKFWLLVGLMESGSVDMIQHEVKTFHPKDVRLLLALHLGCFLLEHYRVAEKQERKVAADICKYLGVRISPLRQQLLQEFKSELLEIQKGEMKSIEFPLTHEDEERLLKHEAST